MGEWCSGRMVVIRNCSALGSPHPLLRAGPIFPRRKRLDESLLSGVLPEIGTHGDLGQGATRRHGDPRCRQACRCRQGQPWPLLIGMDIINCHLTDCPQQTGATRSMPYVTQAVVRRQGCLWTGRNAYRLQRDSGNSAKGPCPGHRSRARRSARTKLSSSRRKNSIKRCASH